MAAAILLFIAWQLAAPMFAGKKKPPPAPPVKVATAMRKDVTVMQNTIGTVVSPAMVQVTAQVTGKLLVANFREGDIVHKGDVLFQIDPQPYQAVLDQVDGQLARDTATLANDRLDLSRYQSLAQQNAISNQQLATQAAKVKSDEGMVITDKAQVDAARINLAYTRITSPIDGKTGPIFIQPGNVIPAVSAASQPLVTITQIQPIKVSFQLPQNGLAQIQNQYNQHRLMAVVPMAGAPGGSGEGAGRFRQQCGQCLYRHHRTSRRFSQYRHAAGARSDRQCLRHHQPDTGRHRRAARRGQSGPRQRLCAGGGKDGKVYSRTVQVLNDDGVNDAIQGDVKPGDKVVTDGQLRVTPGQRVRITKGQPAPRPSDAEP